MFADLFSSVQDAFYLIWDSYIFGYPFADYFYAVLFGLIFGFCIKFFKKLLDNLD